MMFASPKLRRVIAPAWRPGTQALVPCVLPAMSAGADLPVADNAAALGAGPVDLIRDTSGPERANLIGRTGGIADALPREPLKARETA
jgi:hypothetical protein